MDIVDPQPGERILDVGCGTGTLTFQMSQRGAHCIGMDADERMIERAQEQYPEIPFFLGDIRSSKTWADQLPGKVDVVFSNAALHWIPKEIQKLPSRPFPVSLGQEAVL
jgi:trans-aconitate methyltransferase